MAVNMRGYNRSNGGDGVNAGYGNGLGIGGTTPVERNMGPLNDSKDSDPMGAMPKELKKEDFLKMMEVEKGE